MGVLSTVSLVLGSRAGSFAMGSNRELVFGIRHEAGMLDCIAQKLLKKRTEAKPGSSAPSSCSKRVSKIAELGQVDDGTLAKVLAELTLHNPFASCP